MVAALTNPVFYTALATLVTAITALVKAFQIHTQVEANAAALAAEATPPEGAPE